MRSLRINGAAWSRLLTRRHPAQCSLARQAAVSPTSAPAPEHC